MRRVLATLSMLCVLPLLAACTQDSAENELPSSTTSVVESSVEQQSSQPVVTAPAGYDTIITADGQTRSYRVVNLAKSYPAPLLFVLHGFGGTAEAMRNYAGFEETVASYVDRGAIVVYPNGTGAAEGLPQSWNAGDCCPFAIYDMVNDVAFFDELISKLLSEFEIDQRQIWSVGHSNGGMMSYRLACELSGRITAIGVAAGALTISSCVPSRSTSALHLHGELDTVVPINGGEFAGIQFPSAQASFETFSTAGKCVIAGSSASCPNGDSVSLVTSSTWTHDWQPEWAKLFVDFFAQQLTRD